MKKAPYISGAFHYGSKKLPNICRLGPLGALDDHKGHRPSFSENLEAISQKKHGKKTFVFSPDQAVRSV
jgi:hypothetical protein